VNLLEVPDDVEAMCECSRAVGTAEMTDASAFVTYVTHQRVLDLVPAGKFPSEIAARVKIYNFSYFLSHLSLGHM
jgi:hypothetical protein